MGCGAVKIQGFPLYKKNKKSRKHLVLPTYDVGNFTNDRFLKMVYNKYWNKQWEEK